MCFEFALHMKLWWNSEAVRPFGVKRLVSPCLILSISDFCTSCVSGQPFKIETV